MADEYNDNYSSEETGSSPDISGAETDGSVSETDDFSFARWQKDKGYKSPDELGKAYGNADKHIGKLETENKKFREYIQTSIPWVQYAEKKYAEEQQKNMSGGAPQTPQQAGAVAPQKENKEDMRGMIKQIAEEIMGPQIHGLRADVTKQNVSTILKTMREDKINFPYMSGEVEDVMNEVLSTTNKAFPVNEQGIRTLYNAAVGKMLPKILSDFRNKVTEDISTSRADREGNFMESDRIGEGGNVRDAHKSIVDSIMGASFGKSQI